MIIAIRKRYGRTLVRQTTFNGSAPWRKHGTERNVGNRALAALDAIAHATRSKYHGVIVRKAASK